MDRLVVNINQAELHEIHAETERFETANEFAIIVKNHGEPSHIHLSFNDELSEAISLPETNHFLKPDDEISVAAKVIPAKIPATGELEISLAYGAEQTTIPVEVDPEYAQKTTVATSQSTGSTDSGTGQREKKKAQPASSGGSQSGKQTIAVLGAGMIALGVAVLGLVQSGISPVVLLGTLVVFGTVGGGIFYLFQ